MQAFNAVQILEFSAFRKKKKIARIIFVFTTRLYTFERFLKGNNKEI